MAFTATEFIERIQELESSQLPIKLHFGCGYNRKEGFLNIDANATSLENIKDYFIMDYVNTPIDIPDSCVDFIFHEDFIEHIDQRSQICFLAETHRILKSGCVHRVNTPDIINSMKSNSDFNKGIRGVYIDEWDKWEHKCLFSHRSLEEIARLVGYSEVVFTTKNCTVSPFGIEEYRPGPGDRHPYLGNIFADLIK